jgi:tetratricopeptide (TPR) repeat protein
MTSERPAGATAPQTPTSGRAFLALEIALLAFICFLPSLAAGFVYDDVILIRDNRYAHSLEHLGRAFTHFFWELDEGPRTDDGINYYRPLVTASYLVGWSVSQGKPWFFHLFNVLAHAAATYLAVVLLKRWTQHLAVAVLGGLLFALHPSRTESVVWVAGRTDVMMALFMLLSVELSYRAARSERGWRALSLSLICFVLALLSKESAASLPLLLYVDYAQSTSEPEKRRFKLGIWAHAALAAIYVVIRTLIFPVWGLARETAFTPRYGFLTVYAYVERVLFPWPQTFFHRPLASDGKEYLYPTYAVVLGAIIMVAYAVLVVHAWRRSKMATALLVAVVAAFGPLLNFTYTGIFVTTSDHFLYLPLLLFFAAVGVLYGEPLAGVLKQRFVVVSLGGLFAVYVGVDLLRTYEYRDQDAMVEREVELNPHNPIMLKTLAEVRAREGDIDQAFSYFLAAAKPEAKRYTLLLPDWMEYQNYLRLLGLQASRTSDGAVDDLQHLFAEFDSILLEQPPPWRGQVGELQVGRRMDAKRQKDALKGNNRSILPAEAAFIATRLGEDKRARQLLANVREDLVDKLPNSPNVALAYARLGMFAKARRWCDLIAAATPLAYTEKLLPSLRSRLDRAERLFARAAQSPTDAPRLRAEAYLELGAYLRALRVLRPDVEAHPDNPRTGSLYVHLLIASGLDDEALRTAAAALGPARAQQFVAEVRRDLPEAVKKQRKPGRHVDWFVSQGAP